MRYLFFTVYLFTFSVFSQNQNLLVEYHSVFGDDEFLIKIGKEEFDKYKNEVEKQRFTLVIIDNNSFFNTVEDLDNKLPIVRIHTNLTTKQSLRVIDDSKLLIKLPRDIQWQMTSESKVIQGFACYKAVSSYEVVRGDITFNFPIIAWFTPEIPHAFGPKGYFGLPGLILELQERNITYGAKKIEFYRTNNLVIPNIPNFKLMTEREWEELAFKRMMDQKN